MSDAKEKWLRQEQAVRATQMAFDLSSEVQKLIKKQAIDPFDKALKYAMRMEPPSHKNLKIHRYTYILTRWQTASR